MAFIFLDTETTGLGSTARAVSIAILLETPEAPLLLHALIRPHGFEIPPEATAIHGITTKVALEFGKPLEDILANVSQYLKGGSLLVGHNVGYDKRILDYDAQCLGEMLSWPQTFCTMRKMRDICKISTSNKYSPSPFTYKLPTLGEAYEWMFNQPLVGAHGALADMLACREIFYEGQRRRLWP